MARASKKPLSRRRAAALKFLSNISFENSLPHREEVIEERVHIESECSRYMIQAVSHENESLQEFVFSKHTETEFSAPLHSTPTRERSCTTNSEIIRQAKTKKKKTHPLEEVLPPLSFSSTESISLAGSAKQKMDFSRKLPKQKEVKITNASNLKNCKNERIMLVSTASKIPFYVFSLLPYKKVKGKGENKKESGSRRRNLSGSRPLSSFMDTLDPFLLLGLERFENGQMISYQQLLLPSLSHPAEEKGTSLQESGEVFVESMPKNFHISRCMSIDLGDSLKLSSVPSSSPPFTEFRVNDWEEFGMGNAGQPRYSPFLLDDPELMSGKHRTVLTFPSYRASIIDYVRPSELKKELNEKFKEKFPLIQLTLSKLRSLKKEMKSISKSEKCVDLLTVAQSYVFFEKLILRNIINKTNRKVCAAVCLLLSAKMNDTKGVAVKQLLEKLESVFRLSRKEILASEFAVVVALEFSLHVPTWEVLPHFQRLTYES